MKRNLTEISQELNRQSDWKALPDLIFITDQKTQPFPENIIESLPHDSMVIFRDYDHENRAELASALRYICKTKGIKFLVAGDLTLALMVDADGIHLPEHMINEAKTIRDAHSDFFITGACHANTVLEYLPKNELDAVLFAPIFATTSHPETLNDPTLTIGSSTLKDICEDISVPVYALGGVNEMTAKQLIGTGVAGIAAISGF